MVIAEFLPRPKRGALPGSQGWIYVPTLAPSYYPLEALTDALAG